MKDLNLNAMGVTEMSGKEVSTINGGARYFLDGMEISESLAKFLMRLENYEVQTEGLGGTPAWLGN